MEGVFILLCKKYEWKAASSILQDLNKFIKQDLIQFDKENIKQKTMASFKQFRKAKYYIMTSL